MSIEEQIAALEARIQACMISVAGATDIAEQAAMRAEQAAGRAELAALGSQQAEAASVVAAEIATVEAATAIEAVEEVQEIAEQVEEEAEVLEDARTNIPSDEGGSGSEGEAVESTNLLDGSGQTEESTQPIILRIETHNKPEPTLFKPNRTAFRRGRKA